MSSPQVDEATRGGEPGTEPAAAPGEFLDNSKVSEEQVRQVVRLLQCPVCSRPLRDPFILPCGSTICRGCLPRTHQRTNISFFSTSDRLQAVWCPVPGCPREHALVDCSSDVAVGRILDAVKARIEQQLDDARKSKTSACVRVRNCWEDAGVPSLRPPETSPMLLPGGRLLATYAMADMEELKHDDEVVYHPPTDSQTDCDARVLSSIREAARPEVDCQICYALFHDPVTTPCGHTFCRSCLQRVIDHARYCPVCRRLLSAQPVSDPDGTPANRLMTRMISVFWPDQLEERRRMATLEGISDGSHEYDLPIFICALSFPSMPTFLHVFEPRYRLMIRRALEGDRTFGMVLGDDDGFMKQGTLLRIVNVEFFADGRSLLETIGVSRFEVLEHGIIDGYVVAKIQNINDVSMAEEEELEAADLRNRRDIDPDTHSLETSPRPRSLSPSSGRRTSPQTPEDIAGMSTRDLMEYGVDFVRRMREKSAPWLTARMLAIYGQCPSDPALFPWWFASMLPVREAEKYRLLKTTSVRERLKMCCGWILEWADDGWSFPSCVVM